MARNRMDGGVLDVAVVGGGVGGIYSAWRLLTDGKQDRKVALFESGTRIGGRLCSVAPPDIPTARVEIGGMRYTSSHLQVVGLVDYLNLATESFVVGEPNNLAYVRGRRLRTKDLGNAAKIPYDLEQSEVAGLAEGMTALAAENFLKIVLNKKKVDLKTVDWLKVAKTGRYEGKKLTDLSLRYLFSRSVGHEAFQYAFDTSGYDSIFFTWNAADGFPWNLADFGDTVTYSHVTGGYVTVATELQQRFQEVGGLVQFRHRLKSFDTVTLDDGTTAVEMKFVTGAKGQPVTVIARKLVLAMPRRSLELLDPTGAVMDPANTAVHKLIKSVVPIPLFKLALAYKTRWWEPALNLPKGKVAQGQTVTDLPIRQCYYWNVEDTKTKSGVILVYDDGSDLEYWASLRCKDKSGNFKSKQKAPKTALLPNWDEFPAPKLMVDEAHRQLLQIHGVTAKKSYEPFSAAFVDWGADPYGGGANFWPLHVESQEVSRQILQPKPGVPVYICGEAYSHQQGWVEGALATAEEMLQLHLGLGAPKAPLVSPKMPRAKGAKARAT